MGPRSTRSSAWTRSQKATTKRGPSQTAPHNASSSNVRLRLAIDMGTKALKMAYDILPNDRPTQLSKIHPIYFDLKGTEAPMIIGYDQGRFYWGFEAIQLIEAGSLKHYISLLKLCLYSDHLDPKTAPIQKETHQKLHRMDKTLDEVLVQCLVAFIEYAKANIRKHAHSYDIDQMPMDTFITVPQLWTPIANRRMTSAARAAGVDSVRLVYEPECAAAFVLAQELIDETEGPIEHWLQTNDVVLVCDIGGGTADLISFKLLSSPQNGAKVVLNVQTKPQGYMCGSEFVNRRFLNWVKSAEYLRSEDELEKKAEELQITLSELLDSPSRQFENRKVDYNPHIPIYTITIAGSNGKEYKIKFTQENMRSFFDSLINEIVDHLYTQLVPKTRVIMVSGGFGKCVPFMSHLRKVFNPKGVKVFDSTRDFANAVSRGALLRHRNVQVEGLRARSQWGIRWDEEFHASLHPDALIWYDTKNDGTTETSLKLSVEREIDADFITGEEEVISPKRRTQQRRSATRQRKRTRLSLDDDEDEDSLDKSTQLKYKPNLDIVKSSDLMKCEVVLDRLCWLNQKDTIITDNSTWQSSYGIQERYIPVNSSDGGNTTVIEEDIYWTDAALDNSIPLYPDRNHPEKLHPDIHKWASISKCITDASSHGWDIVKDK